MMITRTGKIFPFLRPYIIELRRTLYAFGKKLVNLVVAKKRLSFICFFEHLMISAMLLFLHNV